MNEKAVLGKFNLPLSKDKYIGIKIDLMREEMPDEYKQNKIINEFKEEIEKDGKEWIKNNTPQLKFESLKSRK
ncbi:MAG: hypothetical protein ABIJ17_02480 [Patescibacteria group bacterium]